MGITIGAIVVIVLVVGGIILVSKVSDVFGALFDITKAIKGTDFSEIEVEIETTPKSVNGMTSLCLPRITADFPEFNWHEFKQKAQNMLISAFRAISEEDISCVENASSDLSDQIGLIIDANRDAHLREYYKDVKIHQTEIKDYRKMGGNCIITLQSAVGMIHYKTKAGGVCEGSDTNMCQKRYNIELLYVQDESKIAYGQKALGNNCPNCGAPIKDLGSKTCPYCGCGVETVNVRAWVINRYFEA